MHPRRGGWWGLAFLGLLLIQASMVSVPTAADATHHVRAFYDDHASVIVAAQLLGAIALLPFVLFARALARTAPDRARTWIMPAVACVVVTELVTNAIPLWLSMTFDGSDTSIDRLVRANDLADALLLLALAGFALTTSVGRGRVLLWLGRLSAGLMALGALLSFAGVSGLEAAAPISFIVFVLGHVVAIFREGSPGPPAAVPRA